MSILETFYYMFTADTTAVKEGVKEAQGPLNELVGGLVKADKSAEGLKDQLVELAKTGVGGFIAAFSLNAIRGAIVEVAKLTEEFGEQAKQLDINIEDLSAWDGALQHAGGEAGKAAELIKGLGEKLDDASSGSGDAFDTFKKLGLSLGDIKRAAKDPTEALRLMADEVKKLDHADALKLGEKIGLDRATIDLLSEGRRGVDAVIAKQKSLGVITKEQAEVSAKFNEQLRKTKGAFTDIGRVMEDSRRSIMTAIMPAVTAFLKRTAELIDFLTSHKNVVVGFFGAVAAMITAYYLPAIIRAGIATYALLAPYIAIAAAVAAVAAAFALAYDDVMAFLDGQDSVIGKLAERWPVIGEIVRNVADVVRFFFDLCKAGFQYLGDLIEKGPIVAFENLQNRVLGILTALSAKFPTLGAIVETVGKTIINVGGFIIDRWMDVFKTIARVVEFAIGAAAKVAGLVGGAIGAVVKWVNGKGDTEDKNDGTGRARNGMYEAGTPQTKPEPGVKYKPSPSAPILADANGKPVPMPTAAQIVGGKGGAPAALPAKQQLAAVSANPISAQTSNSINNAKTVSKTTSVKVDKVEVQTQATDANGIAQGIGSALSDQMRGAINQFDDGVAA